MTENRNPGLVLRANINHQAGVTDELQRGASPTLVHADTEFQDRVIEEEFYASASSSKVGPLMDDPDTPTKTSAQELEQLRNESRTTVAQGGSSSSATQVESSSLPRSSNPPSRKSSPSLKTGSEWRVLRDRKAQEQARIDYLQGVGLALASTRRFTDHEQPGLQPLPDSSEDEALRSSLDSTRQALQKFKLRKKRRSADDDDPEVLTPSPTSLKSNNSFRAQRTREGANWFAVGGSHASKTLPPGFRPPEGLAESSPSRKSGSLRGTRSESLRLRNDRLPPGYTQPHEQPLIVASASVPDREVFGETDPTRHGLSLLPPLDPSPERPTAVPLIPDPDEEFDQCITAPLSIPQRSAPDLTIDTTMSGALPGPSEHSNRESRLSEAMEEFGGGRRPDLPPKSPDRPSERNSALLSNRGNVVFPVPDPLPEQEVPAVKPNLEEPQKTSWMTTGVIAILWAIAFALTVSGISRLSPFDLHQAACTLEHVQTCTPPSLSFVHNMRLNTTLPKALLPHLPLIQPLEIQNLDIIDLGMDIEVQNNPMPLVVRGAMGIGTIFVDDKANLLSNMTYYGVLDGIGNANEAKRRLRYTMEQPGDNNDGNKRRTVLVQGESRQIAAATDRGSITQLFFALWLGCLLAVELTLLLYGAIALVRYYWLKPDGVVKGEGEEKTWTHGMLAASGLALRILVAGAFGTAAASGIMVTFWA